MLRAALVAAFACHAAAMPIDGLWRLEGSRLTLRLPNQIINPERTVTLTEAELLAISAGELRRDAGVFRFTGHGEGEFRFVENPAFLRVLRTVATDWHDIEKIFDLAVRNLTLAEVRGWAWLTVPRLPLHTLLNPRPPDSGSLYTQRLQQSGYVLMPEDIERLKTNNVSPDLLQRMKVAGYDALPVTDMIKLQNYGVTSIDIQTMEARGLRNLTADEIVKIKVQGLPP